TANGLAPRAAPVLLPGSRARRVLSRAAAAAPGDRDFPVPGGAIQRAYAQAGSLRRTTRAEPAKLPPLRRSPRYEPGRSQPGRAPDARAARFPAESHTVCGLLGFSAWREPGAGPVSVRAPETSALFRASSVRPRCGASARPAPRYSAPGDNR